MSRPPKDLNTPELEQVKQSREELLAAEDEVAKLRKKYDDDVVAALESHGLRTLAKVAGVSTAAIRDVRDKRAATA